MGELGPVITNSQIKSAAERLECWIVNEALPLWQKVGMSTSHGGHIEQLNADGSADAYAKHRVRVQWRQVFVYAFSSHKGWCQGDRQALGLIEFIQSRAIHPTAEAGFVHLLDADFQIIDSRQDLYDHAFAFLAYAWCYRVFDDRRYLCEAHRLLKHLDRDFGSPCGGWVEGDYAYQFRRQNPHMHLFESFMALYEASGEPVWLARAGEIFGLFQTRFYDDQREVLFEFFNDDWSLGHQAQSAPVEPGHMMEWVWLLDWYQRLSGHPVEAYCEALYRKALTIGESQSGLLWDEVTYNGTVLKPTKRCWGLTELIKASLVRARSGDRAAEARAVQAIEALFHYYICAPTPGAYIDQRGEKDEVTLDKSPASTLYHLLVMASEVSDYVQHRAQRSAARSSN